MTDLTATGLPLDNTADTAAEQYDPAHDYHALNAMLNLYDADGKIQFDKDKAAEREYVTGHVATNSKRFAAERLEYLISNQYYNPAVFNQYSAEFLDRIYEHVESAGFEFGTFLGAFKFYTSYALKTFDGRLYLEDFPQRCAAVALELAAGNEQQAIEYADEMLAGRFQPATPTFLNLGKAQRGEPVSCFLVRIEDNMESISRGINAALQLSKRGGGVALLLSGGQTCTAVLLDNSLGVQYSGNVPAASHILRAADGFYLLTDSTVECFNKAGEFQWTQPMDAKPQAGVLNGRQLLVFSGNTVQQVTAPEPDSSSAS